MCFTPKINAPPIMRPDDALTAAYKQRQSLAGMKGQASTVLTSPLGASDYNTAQPKTILGG